jgi:hypothetical protein
MGTGIDHVSTSARRDRMWLLNAFAIKQLTLLGPSEKHSDTIDKSSQTPPNATLPRFSGRALDLRPVPQNSRCARIPDARLFPLAERFAPMLANFPWFADTFRMVS